VQHDQGTKSSLTVLEAASGNMNFMILNSIMNYCCISSGAFTHRLWVPWLVWTGNWGLFLLLLSQNWPNIYVRKQSESGFAARIAWNKYYKIQILALWTAVKLIVRELYVPWMMLHWEMGDCFAPAKSTIDQYLCAEANREVDMQQYCWNQYH